MNFKNLKSVYVFGLCLLIFSGCKDSSSEKATGNKFPVEFQKVWQDDEFGAEGDELGIHFTDDKVIIWDYSGDDFDQGEDCYYIDEAGTLISFEGDMYTIRIEDPESDIVEEIKAEITIKNGKLIVDESEDSDSFSYSDTDQSFSELSPSCADNAKRISKRNKNIFIF